MSGIKQKLFRDADGQYKDMLDSVEGTTFIESPIDFYIILSRYKFASKILSNKEKVIEVGCGHGYGSVMLSKYVESLVATDIDNELITACKKNFSSLGNCEFKTMDLLSPKSEDISKYDALVSLDVIEHFEKNDINKAVEGYYSLLKKVGVAVIGTPNINSQPYASARRKASHPYEFSYEEFDKALSNKFENVFIFSMTDEVVSTSFSELAWYFIAICVKS